MLRRLYRWTLSLAGHPQAERWLALVSCLESSVFPIPPDVMLMPMCLARPKRAWRYAFICTGASLAGALIGYMIGLFLFEAIGQPVLQFYGYEQAFASFQSRFNDYGVLAVLVFGLTPLPFKVITLASGVAALPLLPFLLASLVARALRFYAVAALLWRYGAPMKLFIERYFNMLATLFTLLLVGGFLVLKFLL
ncbi:MAG: DedA family protein [Alphaproteobacteria bacterium]|nr:MAG: DedA family protein [Alphaproteobacteria bacterium]